MTRDSTEGQARSAPVRWGLFVIGLASTVLALVGALLPVLPTTPFLILAAACFVRSSPGFHQRLLANRMFGPYLRQWQHDHTVPRDAKRKAYGLVILSFTISIVLTQAFWLRLTLAGIGLALLILLRCLPTTPRSRPADEASSADSTDATIEPRESTRRPAALVGEEEC